MEKKIGICIYRYGLGISPSLINLGEELVRSGYGVDYFIYEAFIGSAHEGNEKIKIYRLGKGNNASNGTAQRAMSMLLTLARRHAGKFVLKYKRDGLIGSIFQRVVDMVLENEIKRVIEMAGSVVGENRYCCFVGIEPGGLMMARGLATRKQIPYAYYNLELGMFDDDKETLDLRFFAKHEKECANGAAFAMIQDMDRARVLSEKTGMAIESIHIVPVTAIGKPYTERSDWFRKKLNIPKTSKVILYAGSLADWAMCAEIAAAARMWPDDWILVLHGNGGVDDKYLQELKRNKGENVVISTEPVPYEKLAELLSSADIGIALYKNFGKNFTLIGAASGKLAHYLKSGLPVIANAYPSIKNVIETYGCGECVDSPDEMKVAIERLLKNYNVMRQKAFVCYEDRYEFTRYFRKVKDAFDKMCM